MNDTLITVSVAGETLEIDASRIDASIVEIRSQVIEYDRGNRRRFELSVRFPDGFTGDVMRAMARIPFGETRSYGEIADSLDTAPVAVGQACGRNPIPLIIPCHRVVGADGGLVGYSAANGVSTKRRLLDFERRIDGIEPCQTRLPTE